MKITNVTPGLIPIPPNGWGAVEKIIWEKHNNLQKLGHHSDIKYLNEVDKRCSDIIHIHVANLALEAHKRGIPYYFTMHDHHSYLHGKNSDKYKENYEAIKNSVLSFLPAPYLIDYFGLDNVVYLPHGVNTEAFTPSDEQTPNSILCVAHNGYAHNPVYDRKGFRSTILNAKSLDMPITICGPEKNNKQFFDKNSDLLDYQKLTIKYNLSEDELVDEYKKHGIFLHLSELEAGHPNLTILEAMASGLVVVGTLDSKVNIDGFVRVSDQKDATSELQYAIDNWQELRTKSLNSVKEYNWYNITKRYMLNYKYNKETIRHIFMESYETAEIKPKPVKEPDNIINIDFIDGPKVEIIGGKAATYEVKFIDADTDELVYGTEIQNNQWAKASPKYFRNWLVTVYENGVLISEHQINPEGKCVYVQFDSSAIGDTIAWIPYVEEFRKKWNCQIICSTFHNDLFRNVYKDIKFVNTGQEVKDVYIRYTLGWYYSESEEIDYYRNPINFRQQPLQKSASDILGLDYKEIKPKVDTPNRPKTYDKLVLISIQSTTQAKYWNNPTGWDVLVKYLKDNGYTVACIDKHNSFGIKGNFNTIPSGVLDWTDDVSLRTRAAQIKNADIFIGIGSGISWLSWAVGTPTAVISGFSYPYTEMQDCIRIATPKGKCTGCFNRYRLDPGDWNWCPDHKGTERQFECSKSITAEMVIEQIKEII